MVFGRTLTYSSYTPYSICLRMAVYQGETLRGKHHRTWPLYEGFERTILHLLSGIPGSSPDLASPSTHNILHENYSICRPDGGPINEGLSKTSLDLGPPVASPDVSGVGPWQVPLSTSQEHHFMGANIRSAVVVRSQRQERQRRGGHGRAFDAG